MIDFEYAVFKSLVKLGVSVYGCSFHFQQAILRKANNLGLMELYRKNDNMRRFIRKFMHLCYLPKSLIKSEFNKLKRTVDENVIGFSDHVIVNLKLFVEYFETTWMTNWPLDLWNCSCKMITTNNICEGFHSSLCRRIEYSKPEFPMLLLHWSSIERRELAKLTKMKSGMSSRSVAISKHSRRILRIARNCYNGSITVETFFSKLDELKTLQKFDKIVEMSNECGEVSEKIHVKTRRQTSLPISNVHYVVKNLKKNNKALRKFIASRRTMIRGKQIRKSRKTRIVRQ